MDERLFVGWVDFWMSGIVDGWMDGGIVCWMVGWVDGLING
jgi:hypothetical protein